MFRYVRECATGAWQERTDGCEYFAGLDLARVEDFTVLAILDRDRRIVFVDRFRKQDWSIQLQRIKAGLDRYGNPDLYVDSTGAGQPIYEHLRSEGVNAFGYTFTRQSKDALIDCGGLGDDDDPVLSEDSAKPVRACMGCFESQRMWLVGARVGPIQLVGTKFTIDIAA